MKEQKFSGKSDNRILTAMILDSVVLGRIQTKWIEKGLFDSPFANKLGAWCVSYYQRYGKAPGKHIQKIFEEKITQNGMPESEANLIERLLLSLSDDYDGRELNSEFESDFAGKHFDKVRLDMTAQGVQDYIQHGQINKAKGLIAKYTPLELGQDSTIDFLTDYEQMKDLFEHESEDLIQYRGALGQFFRRSLGRDCFVAFMGPEKKGKSIWLLDIAWRSVLQRKKVAYFELGDMGKYQTGDRLMARIAKHPRYVDKNGTTLKIPTVLKRDNGQLVVEHEEKLFKEGLSPEKAWKAYQKHARVTIRSKQPYMKLVCHSTYSLGVSGIKSQLDMWNRDGWTPDVLIVDYADLLAPPNGVKEKLEEVDQNWGLLRSLSLELHCLVVTATQTNSQSYSVETITMKHFSQNHRKLAYITGMIGLNQKDSEKELGLMRLNWVARRDAAFTNTKYVHCAGCIGISNPSMLSSF
jgi:hypothetical protein